MSEIKLNKEFRPNAIVIDFESGSLKPDAAILGGAMIAFNMDIMDSPDAALQLRGDLVWHNNLNLLEVFMLGCDFDKETGKWWGKQSEAAKNSLMGKELSPVDFITGIKDFIKHVTTLNEGRDIPIFCRHTHADWIWLDQLCVKLGVRNPIKYNRIFDISSYIFSRTGNIDGYIKMDYLTKGDRHHPLVDVYQDACQLAKSRTQSPC